MNHYKTLGVSIHDSLPDITKKYKYMAKKYHPDKNSNNTIYTEKFKEINVSYSYIKNNHNKFFKQNQHEFTNNLLHGDFLKTIYNNYNIQDNIKKLFTNKNKIKFYYDDIFSTVVTDNINIDINVSIEDIYNCEEKLINLTRMRKCDDCFTTNILVCNICNNIKYYRQSKYLVVNCSDQVTLFPGESNQEPQKKTGDVIVKINTKKTSKYSIIDDYNILYTIENDTKNINISHKFVFLDNKKYLFECIAPFNQYYRIKNIGLKIPYTDERGDLYIQIKHSNNNNVFSFTEQI